METKYFATFDEDGWPTGFYPSDVWPEPPEGAVEITEAQYQQLIGNAGLAHMGEDGEVIIDDPGPLP